MALLCQINVPTQVRVPFRMVDATDGTTPEPGVTPSAFICGPTGDTYAPAAGGIVEISNGDFVYTLTTADVSAGGIVLTRFTGTGAMEARGVPVQVVGFDPTANIQNPTGGTVTTVTNAPTGMALEATSQSIKTETDKIAAVKTKTDSLTFTVAGVVNAGVYYVNGVQIDGDGQDATPWGPV